jgi:hypothetical protein
MIDDRLWHIANNGNGKRIWFLVKGQSIPLEERFLNNAKGNLIRYATAEQAQAVADDLNAEIRHSAIEVTVTRSDGADGAVLVIIDGMFNENGQPPLRVLVNDDPVFAQVPYEPTSDGRVNECDAKTLFAEFGDLTYTGHTY